MIEHLTKHKKTPVEDIPKKEVDIIDFEVSFREGFKPLFTFMSDPHLNAHQYNLPQRAKDMMDAFREALYKSNELLGDGGLIVIGGDIFNTPIVSPSTLMKTAEIMRETGHSMAIKSCRGNHDGSFMKAQRKNISLIPLEGLVSNFEYIESGCIYTSYEENIMLIFQSYDHNMMERLLQLSSKIKESDPNFDNSFKILVMHGIVEGCVPFGWDIPRDEFKQFLQEHNIDLVLTGHLHKKLIDRDLNLLNPGSLECLDIDQSNMERGFFMIGIENGKLAYQWIPIRTRAMEDVTIDVGDISNANVDEIIKERLSTLQFPEGAIVRFSIIGQTSKNLNRVDKGIFSKKFPHLMKLFVKNKIRYSKEGDEEIEMLSPKIAIQRSLKDAGVSDEDLEKISDAMMDISNESSKRLEGWQQEIRKIIKKEL